MENRITDLFARKREGILSVYCTAGFPRLGDTRSVIEQLQAAGVDMVEIGMPYSDPVADGETIQLSNKQALDNGMSLRLLFEQLEGIRDSVQIPLILMGYLNPVLQYGVEAFCEKARSLGIDGLILPDLPIDLYMEEYRAIFEQYGLSNILLVTPQTSEARIRMIDANTRGFIYLVADNSITGKAASISDRQLAYFARIKRMGLQNPCLIGFGIADGAGFRTACANASGAIVGSAFIRALQANSDNLQAGIQGFVQGIKGA
jgi:tryptophan synthase alpha chain